MKKPQLPPTFATFFGTVQHNAGRTAAEDPTAACEIGGALEEGGRAASSPARSREGAAHALLPSFRPMTLDACQEEAAESFYSPHFRRQGGAVSVDVLVEPAAPVASPGKTRRNAHRLHAVPPSPLRPFVKCVFTASEIPFLILMTYAIYWVEICYLAAHEAPITVWLNAIVAGVLVGIGLNANAYRALYRPMSRARKRQAEKRKGLESGRFVESVSPMSYGGLSTRSMRICAFVSSAHMPLKWSEDDTEFDLGMMIRFFIIPFAVSSLSGITNNAREEFLLVFPRDPATLAVFVLIPSLIDMSLIAMRLYFILTIPVRPFWKAVFLNGKILL